jgi:hypothetical protein
MYSVLRANNPSTSSMISNSAIFEERGCNQVIDPVVVEIQLSNSEIFHAAENKGMF